MHNIRFDACVMDRKAAISSDEASVMSECECPQLITLLKDWSFPQMERKFGEFRESDISVHFTLTGFIEISDNIFLKKII